MNRYYVSILIQKYHSDQITAAAANGLKIHRGNVP